MKRGNHGRRSTVGRIERGGGNGGDPVRSPPGWLDASPAGHGGFPGHAICGRAGISGGTRL